MYIKVLNNVYRMPDFLFLLSFSYFIEICYQQPALCRNRNFITHVCSSFINVTIKLETNFIFIH